MSMEFGFEIQLKTMVISYSSTIEFRLNNPA